MGEDSAVRRPAYGAEHLERQLGEPDPLTADAVVARDPARLAKQSRTTEAPVSDDGDPNDPGSVAYSLRATLEEEVQRTRRAAEHSAKRLAKRERKAHEDRVQERRETIRVNREAEALEAAAASEAIELPPQRLLREFLAESTEPAPWRVEGLLQCGGNGLLNAKAKAGKTTLRDNLLRSLVDGDPFLGRFDVRPVGGRVTLLDFELPEETLRDWLRVQGFRDLDALEPVSLKGKGSRFDVRRDNLRARWAERLAGTDVLVLDALSPLLGALGMNENNEAGDLLPFLDALKAEADIGELYVVHHQGHGTERARGDSRLMGWPDAIWTLNRREDDPTRYLSATGRDVDLPETALAFDPVSKRLQLGVGSRRAAQVGDALGEVVQVLQLAGTPMPMSAIERAFSDSDLPRSAVRAALEDGVRTGFLALQTGGPRGAKLYRTTS